jgi:hypothetical protein
MAEEGLDNLKAALFDPMQPQPDTDQIFRLTQQLAAWRNMSDGSLVSEYRAWKQRAPGMAAALVRAAREREKTEAIALCRFLGISSSFAERAISQRTEARA